MQPEQRRPLLRAAGWSGNWGRMNGAGLSRDDYNMPGGVMQDINLVIFQIIEDIGVDWNIQSEKSSREEY